MSELKQTGREPGFRYTEYVLPVLVIGMLLVAGIWLINQAVQREPAPRPAQPLDLGIPSSRSR